jgi:hypothetical protein
MSAEQRQFTRLRHDPGIRVTREYYSTEAQPNAGWWSRRCHAVEVDLWTMVNHFNRPKSGQWQQSMFPRGCIGWRMATTAVASDAAVETSAMETTAMVAAMTRRRVRAGVVIVIVTAPRLLGVSP